MRELLRRTRYWLRRGRLDAELAEELEHHRRLKARELERRGLSPSEAAVEARRALGNKLVARARARDVWIWPWLQDVSQESLRGAAPLSRSVVYPRGRGGARARDWRQHDGLHDPQRHELPGSAGRRAGPDSLSPDPRRRRPRTGNVVSGLARLAGNHAHVRGSRRVQRRDASRAARLDPVTSPRYE